MAALSGERVDIHIMKEPPAGDWIFVSTELTDKAGRINFRLPAVVTFGTVETGFFLSRAYTNIEKRIRFSEKRIRFSEKRIRFSQKRFRFSEKRTDSSEFSRLFCRKQKMDPVFNVLVN
jgi:hypothetical protein